MKLRQGIIITIIVVVVGVVWLAMTAIPGAPLSSLNVGFGLTTNLQQQQIGGGYNMNQLVLFVIFLVIIIILGAIFMKKDSDKEA